MNPKYKNYIADILFSLTKKLPISLQSLISYILFKPSFEKRGGGGGKLYGYTLWGPQVKIGIGTYIHTGSYIAHVSIGRYCRIARNFNYIPLHENEYTRFSNYAARQFTTISFYQKSFFGFDSKSENQTITTCTIGNDVWIGEHVTILGNVTVGNGAVIGAGSIVTKNVAPFSVVAGVPAKFIKYRYDNDKIRLMQKLQWWDWPLKKIYANYDRLCKFDKTLLKDE